MLNEFIEKILVHERDRTGSIQTTQAVSYTHLVDEKKIAFNPAVELSYLKQSEQKEFLEAMDYAQASPSPVSYTHLISAQQKLPYPL